MAAVSVGHAPPNADWNEVLMNINPYTFAFMGVAFAIGFCVLGAAWYVTRALFFILHPTLPHQLSPLHGLARDCHARTCARFRLCSAGAFS